ncbi:hypothetical protein [Arthrobacter sp. AG1021]|uniref:hypothetical protein n=1 Tax=Arthrobacter sp. AG1021 TaxID=2183908 RepID=UPI0011C3BCA6|nr:hypothetical protein [Arthrobacter sp. AG1021]
MNTALVLLATVQDTAPKEPESLNSSSALFSVVLATVLSLISVSITNWLNNRANAKTQRESQEAQLAREKLSQEAQLAREKHLLEAQQDGLQRQWENSERLKHYGVFLANIHLLFRQITHHYTTQHMSTDSIDKLRSNLRNPNVVMLASDRTMETFEQVVKRLDIYYKLAKASPTTTQTRFDEVGNDLSIWIRDLENIMRQDFGYSILLSNILPSSKL